MEFREAISEYSEKPYTCISWNNIRKDIMRFIKNERDLNSRSADYFRDLMELIKFES